MTTNIDYAAITERQKATWSEGDFNVLALGVMPASEAIVGALDVHAGERVLDIACGSGTRKVLASLEPGRHADFDGELLDVFRRYNRAKDGSAAIESRCMQLLATKN